jgi:4'-phosphopantetheinyl transferase
LEPVIVSSKAAAVDLVCARLDAPGSIGALSAWLCDAERSRAERLLEPQDRRRFIVGRGLLRAQLAARLGTAPEAVGLAYGKNGKPALAAPWADTGWCFNVSHCDDVAVYAFARGAEVGVDVEAVRSLPEADAIAARFFAPRENERYLNAPDEDRPLAFYSCWTRKEAFVKALGAGLSVPLDQLDLSVAPPGWSVESFVPLPGFIAALARRLS